MIHIKLVTYKKITYYILKLLYPKYPLYTFPLFIKFCLVYYNIYKHKYKIKVKLSPLPIKLYDEFMATSLINNKICDKTRVIIVSKLVYNYLTFGNSHNWVRLIQNEYSGHRSSERIIQIIPCDMCAVNSVFTSENNYFNVCKYFKRDEDTIIINLQPHKFKIPTIANDLVISFIASPLEIPNDLLISAIGIYFRTPKLVYADDIYEIVLNGNNVGDLYYKYMHLCDAVSSIYFKCINVSGTRNLEMGYFVVKDITTIQQKQDISSLLPRKKMLYCAKNIFNKNAGISLCIKKTQYDILNKCPDGLFKYYQILLDSLSPFVGNHSMMHIQPIFSIQGPIGVGKNIIVESVSRALGVRLYNIDCSDLMCTTTGQSEAKIKYIFERAKMAAPVILCLQNFEIFGLDQENELDMRLIHYFQSELDLLLQNNDHPIIVIALCNSKTILPTLQRMFLESMIMNAPDENERKEILQWILCKNDVLVGREVVESLATKTGGFLFEDLKLLVLNTIKSICNIKNKNMIDEKHFDIILEYMQSSYRDSIGAPKIPKVKWSDIGGLADLKQEIIKSMKNPTGGLNLLSNTNSRRAGILLYGPPGTGKTLLAKAIATESKFNFLSVKGPELLNMYVGQSEQNVRDVFERARAATPCVIFFDELDSLAPNRGAKGDSGGIMDSIVAQLLSEMDGIENDSESHVLFIVGATNRPDLLDPALLRPGRLDKLLYVGLCETTSAKYAVLSTILSKFNLNKDVDIEAFASMLVDDMSGADLHSICSKAWMNAVRRLLQNPSEGDDIRQRYTAEDVQVSMDDLVSSFKNFVPSVSPSDMAYFKQMQQSKNSKE